MLQLPEIYAENIHRWLPELLYYSLTTLEDRLFLLRLGRSLWRVLCRSVGRPETGCSEALRSGTSRSRVAFRSS